MKKYINWLVSGAIGVASFLLTKEIYEKKRETNCDADKSTEKKDAATDNKEGIKNFYPIPNATESIDDDDDDQDD